MAGRSPSASRPLPAERTRHMPPRRQCIVMTVPSRVPSFDVARTLARSGHELGRRVPPVLVSRVLPDPSFAGKLVQQDARQLLRHHVAAFIAERRLPDARVSAPFVVGHVGADELAQSGETCGDRPHRRGSRLALPGRRRGRQRPRLWRAPRRPGRTASGTSSTCLDPTSTPLTKTGWQTNMRARATKTNRELS